MRAFETRRFHKWAVRAGVTTSALTVAAQEIERGLIDARLGSYLIKKRVPLAGRGKRGGARIILAYRHADIAFFIYGYAKNERTDIGTEEMQALRRLAEELLTYDDVALARLIESGKLLEVFEQ